MSNLVLKIVLQRAVVSTLPINFPTTLKELSFKPINLSGSQQVSLLALPEVHLCTKSSVLCSEA